MRKILTLTNDYRPLINAEQYVMAQLMDYIIWGQAREANRPYQSWRYVPLRDCHIKRFSDV